MTEPVIYLASRSPRRAELLRQVGVVFELMELDVDEAAEPGERAADYVCRVAEEKAWAGIAVRELELPVLGADTAVVADGDILGKPAGREEALEMLQRLSGCTHRVLSAVAVADGDNCHVALNTTTVTFRRITPAEAASYWATGEPVDKAGAYGIQGMGAVFVERIEGSYSGVMGLPLFETASILERYGISIPGNQRDPAP